MLHRMSRLLIGLFALWIGAAAQAQTSPFGPGWTLEPEASSLQFQSIKNGSKIETSSFATIAGAIGPNGDATLTVALDSVDTKVDLRNVRMRFLFFETFIHPQATVTTTIDPGLVADLAQVRRKTVTLPVALDLHGVTRELEAQLALTLIGDDLVAVSTAEPLNIGVADFGLMDGLEKLQEAASVTIVPSTAVSFDLIFRKSAEEVAPAVVTAAGTQSPARTALESEGDFSLEACVGRFEILSRTGNIYFRPGSARLDDASTPLLTAVADIVNRCPGLTIQIAGHTDSLGSAGTNQALSEKRAASVVEHLRGVGIPPDRMKARGFGEDRPVAGNDTDDGRGRNRRIEFSVADS